MLTKKICLLGDFSVGKTSLFRRFISNTFSDQYITTVGVKVESKVVKLSPEEEVKLLVWDVAGSAQMSSVSRSYVQGAGGYLLVADGTRPETLKAALGLKDEMDATLGRLPFVGLLNKVDLHDEWQVSGDFIDHNPDWMLSSALTGENVDEAFVQLTRKMVENGD